MTVKRAIVVVLLASSITVSLSSAASSPLQAGSTVTLFLDTSGNLPEPDPGPPTDMLLFTGGRVFMAEVPGCSESPLALQDAVLVDRDGPRASRQVKVLLVGGTGIPAGTRLKNFVPSIDCTSDGISYKKYTATVD